MHYSMLDLCFYWSDTNYNFQSIYSGSHFVNSHWWIGPLPGPHPPSYRDRSFAQTPPTLLQGPVPCPDPTHPLTGTGPLPGPHPPSYRDRSLARTPSTLLQGLVPCPDPTHPLTGTGPLPGPHPPSHRNRSLAQTPSKRDLVTVEHVCWVSSIPSERWLGTTKQLLISTKK